MRNHPRRPTELVDPDLPWDIGDPGGGELYLTELMQELLTRSNTRPRAIEVGTQLARAQSLQGKLSEAERTLDHAERMLHSVPDLVPRLRALLERGRLLVLRRTLIEAGSRFLEAWLLATTSRETFFAIDAAQMMSVIDAPKKQAQWTFRALELAEGSTDGRVRRWRAHLHYDLGVHFDELTQLSRSREWFESSAECFHEDGDFRSECIARCSMARMLRLMNRAEEALAIQHQVRLQLQRAGLTEGVVYEEIGECLAALKRNGDAEDHFRRAYDLLSKDEWLVDNQPARIRRLKTMRNSKHSLGGRP